MKPSDFPRDPQFRVPGPAFFEDGTVHLRSYRDVKRAMLDNTGDEFSLDASYWAPQGERLHLTWYFVWAAGAKRSDGQPGRHDALRGIVGPWFRTRAMATMAPRVQQIVQTLVRTIIEKGTGEFDMATDLAYPIALRTICSLVGLPLEREHWLRDHLQIASKLEGVSALTRREPQEIEDYFWELVRERQAQPRDELLDLIIVAWQEKKISDLELLGYIWGFFQAGTETAGPHITNLFSLLSEFGLLDQARDRLEDDEWINAANEETLRFATPFPTGPLLVVSDIELEDGLKVPAMTPAQIWFSAANRDQEVNDGNADAASPDVFDISRSPNRHLSFGAGMHYCLGDRLTRLESTIALRTALRYLPGLEMDTSKPFQRYSGMVDGVSSAPFQFDQHEAERLLDELRPTE